MVPETAAATDDAGEDAAPGMTPLRVLSLWVGFTFSVGTVTHMALNVMVPSLSGNYVEGALWGASLVAALVLLRVRPGVDTHVLWRINYGFPLGFWLAFAAMMVSTLTGDWFVVDSLLGADFLAPLAVGFAISAVVEWHRNHREN